jgi:hypothetical protein
VGLCGGFTWRTVATNLIRLKLAVVAECGLFNKPSWQQQELSDTMRWALVLPSRQTIIATVESVPAVLQRLLPAAIAPTSAAAGCTADVIPIDIPAGTAAAPPSAGFTSKGGVLVRGLLQPVKRGDGIVFDQGTPERDEQGGSVWELFVAPRSSGEADFNPSSSSGGRSVSRGGRSSAGGLSRGGSNGSSSSSRGAGKFVASSGRQCQGGSARAGDSVELVFAPGQVRPTLLVLGYSEIFRCD